MYSVKINKGATQLQWKEKVT